MEPKKARSSICVESLLEPQELLHRLLWLLLSSPGKAREGGERGRTLPGLR